MQPDRFSISLNRDRNGRESGVNKGLSNRMGKEKEKEIEGMIDGRRYERTEVCQRSVVGASQSVSSIIVLSKRHGAALFVV